MVSCKAVGFGLLLATALVTPVLGQDMTKNVAAAKAATALVVLPNESGFATAFCVDAAGYFITNYHVVKNLAAGQKMTLVLSPGERNEKSILAAAVRVDPQDDLAVVKADDAAGLTALPLGNTDTVVETQTVTVLGYPFGEALALEKSARPNVSVNLAHVSSMRKAAGKLEVIQLDSQLNPGNSGGPVIDDKGFVIGVVNSGVRAAGINFAIPAGKVSSLLDRPDITCTPPVILDDKIHDAVNLSIHVLPFGKPRPDLSVDVTLTSSDGAERTYPAAPGTEKGLFTSHLVPVPARSGNQLPAVISFADGSIRCWIDDEKFKLDSNSFSLSQVSRIEFKPASPSVRKRDGTVTTGSTLTIAPLTARFGAYAISVDASKAISLSVADPGKTVPNVAYRIVAKSRGAVIGELKGMLLGSGDEIADSGAGSEPAPGAGGPWVSLIPKILPQRDTNVGNWTVQGAVLRNVEQHEVESSRLTIPVRPTGNYVFEFTFVRSQNGKDLCALFPVGDRAAMIWIGSFDGQHTQLDGTDALGRGDLLHIDAGKPYHVEISVFNHPSASDVKMKLNGVDFLSWSGDPRRLQANGMRAIPDGRSLGLAVCHHTVVEFTNIRVKTLSGEITPSASPE